MVDLLEDVPKEIGNESKEPGHSQGEGMESYGSESVLTGMPETAKEVCSGVPNPKLPTKRSWGEGSFFEALDPGLMDRVMVKLDSESALAVASTSRSQVELLGGDEVLQLFRQDIRDSRYQSKINEAAEYFEEFNLKRRYGGVSYKSVASLYGVAQNELRSCVEERAEEAMMESDSD